MSTIKVHISSNNQPIHTRLSNSENPINVTFPEPFIQPYGGPYSLTPKVYEQEFPTEGKRMLEDIVVEAIPDWRVANTSGGVTITIGGIL